MKKQELKEQEIDCEKETLPPIKAGKLALWLRYYTDESNPETFLNKTKSAIYAGYKAKSENSFANIGLQNYRKLERYITKWLDELGLSEARLKEKTLSLMSAQDTKLFRKDNKDGSLEIVEHQIPALEIQRRALDMALKIKGLYKSNEVLAGNAQVNIQINVERLGEALRAELEQKSRAIVDLESDPLD
ncbi:MAG: hypothetical protein KAV87_58595 [Desulfobacteraceae bacterium]|nr:hypothetical protein [Desulfobacteraceae bacterium]